MRQFIYASLSILLCLWLGGVQAQTTHVITNTGFTFTPASLTVTEGDTVDWQLDGIHNVLEVSMTDWNANLNTPLPGGFSLPFGGGKLAFETVGTFYYVCVPHAGSSMKGTITVQAAAANLETFVAHLSGNQETPPVPSFASGMVTAVIDGDSLRVSGSFENLGSKFNGNIGAHLHMGYAGSNGGVEIPLNPTMDADSLGGMFMEADNTFEITSVQADMIRDRQMYVNIHTVGYASGELRGQLLPEGKDYLFTNLLGSNEPTPVYTGATGAMIFELDEANGNILVATGSFRSLQGNFDGNPAGGVHLHAGSAGMNGGIEQTLVPTVDPDMKGAVFTADDNTFILSSAQVDMLGERKIYVNVHSTAYPGGEIRGQVHGMAQAVFRVYLSGANEVPSVQSMGTGQLLGEVMFDTLIVTGSFNGLESDYAASHLHTGMAGQNGGVAIGLTATTLADNRSGEFIPAENSYTLNAAQKTALFDRMIYTNVHSTDNSSGELRGQMLPEANFVFNAYLTGSQEALPVISRGYGVLHGEVRGDEVTVTGSFSGLESDYASGIGSHLHRGYLGQNGGVAVALTPMLDGDNRGATYMAANNRFSGLSAGLADSLLDRAVYANVHTADFNAGELRGQMLQEASAYFFAPLSGASQEPMPVNTPANGMLALEVIGSNARATGSFNDLQSDLNVGIAGGVHIHAGLPGQSGGIIHVINSDFQDDNQNGVFEADSNMIMFSSMGVDSLRNGLFYVNVHSMDVGSGEIRGTLMPMAQAYFTSNLGGINEVNPAVTDGTGDLQIGLNGEQVQLAGSFTGLTGKFNPAIAGGSHLHRAGPGGNGPLFQTLMASITAADSTEGAYLGTENTFTLTEGQVDYMVNGMVYFNLHTTEVASGEIRGQLLGEVNFFPMNAPMISAPASNSTVTVFADSDDPFQATWSESMDENEVVYVWQLSAASDFSSFILNLNVGSMAEFNSDLGTVDSILADAGLNIGDSLLVYHRAIASDGALQATGMTDSVYLKRGQSTNIAQQAQGLSVEVRPTRIQENAQLMIRSDRPAEARVSVLDLGGRVLQSNALQLIGGTQSYGLNLSALSAGFYLIRLETDGYQPQIIRVVKE